MLVILVPLTNARGKAMYFIDWVRLAAIAFLIGFAFRGLAVEKSEKITDSWTDDFRTFYSDGKIDYGNIDDSYKSDLVIYLAGDQFMVVEDLMKDFQKKNPDIKKIYVETIPPGQIFKQQILKQGKVEGKNTAQNPDLFASVHLDLLEILASKEMMHDYMIYIHNKLELMVARGNPKKIKGIKDLGRDDLVQSHPNQLTEGIFNYYAAEMLKDLKLYDKITSGKQCKNCWAVEGKTWFTERNHQDTPLRIENGKADVGIVWSTEVVFAKSKGRAVDGVSIEAPYHMADKVNYVIGALKTGKQPYNALRYLAYLTTDAAQNIYAKYGFIKAKPEEMIFRPLRRVKN